MLCSAEAAVAPESATPSANGKASPPPSPATTAPEDEEDEEVAGALDRNVAGLLHLMYCVRGGGRRVQESMHISGASLSFLLSVSDGGPVVMGFCGSVQRC